MKTTFSNGAAKAYMALLAVYCIWGTTGTSLRISVASIPPFVLPCMRFLLAGILLVAFCLLKGETLPDKKALRYHLIAGLLLFVGGNALGGWTARHLTSGFGGLLGAMTPFWMLGLSALLLRERIRPMAILGMAVGFSGMVILLSPQLSRPDAVPASFWQCILISFGAGFCWALGSIYMRKHAAPSSLLMSVGMQNLLAGICLLPMAGANLAVEAFNPSPFSLGAFAYLIVMGSIAATPCYYYVVNNLPVTVSSTFAYVTPVITVAVGGLFLHEPVTSNTLLGLAVILTGVIVVQCVSHRQPQPAQVEPVERALTPVPAAEPVGVETTIVEASFGHDPRDPAHRVAG